MWVPHNEEWVLNMGTLGSQLRPGLQIMLIFLSVLFVFQFFFIIIIFCSQPQIPLCQPCAIQWSNKWLPKKNRKTYHCGGWNNQPWKTWHMTMTSYVVVKVCSQISMVQLELRVKNDCKETLKPHTICTHRAYINM